MSILEVRRRPNQALPTSRLFFKLSLVMVPLALTGGCFSQGSAGPSFEQPKANERKPPHAGSLIKLGERVAQVELVIDHAEGKMTAYILDGEAEKPVRIRQAELDIAIEIPGVSLKLLPVSNVVTGETAGDTSEFSVTSGWLTSLSTFDATLKTITVRGTTFDDIEFSFP